MNAQEARLASLENAARIAAEEQREQEAKAVAWERLYQEEHRKWHSTVLSGLRSKIKYAVDHGKRRVDHTLCSGGGRDLKLYGSSYLDNAEYKDELRAIMSELEAEGYLLAVVGKQVEYDETAAFLNSGGECGAEKPYWSYDTILEVRW